MHSLHPLPVWISLLRQPMVACRAVLPVCPTLLVAILWGVLFFPLPATAQEFIVGQVVSVDQEAGEVVLLLAPQPDPADRDDRTTDRASLGPTRPRAERRITVTMAESAPGGLPGCIQPGRVIRAWGRFAKELGADRFVAETVRGGGPGQGDDRSGVRSRLHRCRESGPDCRRGRRCQGQECEHAGAGPR